MPEPEEPVDPRTLINPLATITERGRFLRQLLDYTNLVESAARRAISECDLLAAHPKLSPTQTTLLDKLAEGYKKLVQDEKALRDLLIRFVNGN